MRYATAAADSPKRFEVVREVAERPSPATSLPPPAHAGWHISIAVRPDQLRAAEDLVARRYAWRGYQVRSPEAHSVQQTRPVVLLAQHAGRLMGTLTVRPGAPLELLAQASYADEIAELRSQGHLLGEVVKLAVEEGADSRRAMDALVQSAYWITHVVHGLTDVLIEVNPRHVRFYERVLGFVVAAEERRCERVGAPSVLLRLELASFGRRLRLAA